MNVNVILSEAKNLGRTETLLKLRVTTVIFLALFLSLLFTGCAGTPKPPDWVTGLKTAGYPDEQFLIGIGQADSRPVAEERAYAAVSRIFKAEVISQSQDWESYLSLEKKGDVQAERKLVVDTMTKVSTDKLHRQAVGERKDRRNLAGREDRSLLRPGRHGSRSCPNVADKPDRGTGRGDRP